MSKPLITPEAKEAPVSTIQTLHFGDDRQAAWQAMRDVDSLPGWQAGFPSLGTPYTVQVSRTPIVRSNNVLAGPPAFSPILEA